MGKTSDGNDSRAGTNDMYEGPARDLALGARLFFSMGLCSKDPIDGNTITTYKKIYFDEHSPPEWIEIVIKKKWTDPRRS